MPDRTHSNKNGLSHDIQDVLGWRSLPARDHNAFLKEILFSNPTSSEEQVTTSALNTGGLLTHQEALALHRIAKNLQRDAKILEIGSYRGASSVAMGHGILGSGSQLFCLDCWQDYSGQAFFDSGIPPATDLEILTSFINNTSFLGYQLHMLKGKSDQFKHLLPNNFFDLVFIDAAHDYENVYNDILIGMKSLVPGGLLLGHDYHSDGHGVVEAVNQVICASETIFVKGTIPNTSIWYALIDDPMLELNKLATLGLAEINHQALTLHCF